MEWYFVVWYLAATEQECLIQIKIELSKSAILICTRKVENYDDFTYQKLRKETLEWLEKTNRSSGYLFLNRYGDRITTRGISQQLKNYADKYGLDKKGGLSSFIPPQICKELS